jgi:CRISPR/Cas system-associated protein Cas10 (large subunit of type III CRISPR-Cas system)
VDYTISTKKGENIGYGLSMPFNNVTVRLTYRILSKNKAGQMEILAAGVEEARALANSTEDAAAKAMKELAENLTPALLNKVGQYIKGNTKKVAVSIKGIQDLETVLQVKSQLQSIVWVTDVEEKQMGSFVVSYPENTLYLANSIKQKGNFRLVNFSPYSLSFEYIENN